MKQLAQLIYQDMAPAYGVTEPGAIAYACALARAQVPQVEKIWLGVNSGIYKNAFTCAIPGTEEEGGGPGSLGRGCRKRSGRFGKPAGRCPCTGPGPFGPRSRYSGNVPPGS